MKGNQSARVTKMRQRLGLEPEPEKPKAKSKETPKPKSAFERCTEQQKSTLNKARLNKDKATIESLHDEGEITTDEYTKISKRIESLQKDLESLKYSMGEREILQCAGCDNKFDSDDLMMMNMSPYSNLCEDCNFECYWCNDIMDEDNTYHTESGEIICEGCLTNCPNCDNIHHPDELEEDEDTGDHLCEDCLQELKDKREEEKEEEEEEEEEMDEETRKEKEIIKLLTKPMSRSDA